MLKIRKFTVKSISLLNKFYKKVNRKKLLKNKLITSIKFKEIDFEQLVLFYMVVVSGSINLASKRLVLSQPAISLSLKKMEQQLGYILLKNYTSTKSLFLTSYGALLFIYIKRVFQSLNEIIDFSTLKTLSLNTNLLKQTPNVYLKITVANKINNYCFSNTLFSKFFSKNSKILFMSTLLTSNPVKIKQIGSEIASFRLTNSIEFNTAEAINISKQFNILPLT